MTLRNAFISLFFLCLSVAISFSVFAIANPSAAQAEEIVGAASNVDTRYVTPVWHSRENRGIARLCREPSSRWARHGAEHIEDELTLNTQQKAALGKVTEKLNALTAAVYKACTTNVSATVDSSAPEKLAVIEGMTEAALTAMKEVRVAFAEFYATLDSDQKAQVDDFFQHGKRRGWWH